MKSEAQMHSEAQAINRLLDNYTPLTQHTTETQNQQTTIQEATQ